MYRFNIGTDVKIFVKIFVDDLMLKAEDLSPTMQIRKEARYSINYFFKSEGEVE